MMQSLWEKIEAIQQEPEAVRMRYVVGSVSAVMVFVIGIWLLSVHESFTKTAEELPGVIEQGKKDMTGDTPSLNDLFEQSSPLRIEDKGTEGGQFFDQQIDGREVPIGGEKTPPEPKGQ